MVETVYQGRHGNYIILEEHFDKILVKYTSGKWKNKEVLMSRPLHNKIQENIKGEAKAREDLEKEEIDLKLDLWYDKYPNLYKSLWTENIQGETLLEKLEEEYPIPASVINNLL